MSSWISPIHHKLLNPTAFFYLKLWTAIVLCISIPIGLALSITFCCCIVYCSQQHQKASVSRSESLRMMNTRLLSRCRWDVEMCIDYGKPEKEQMNGPSFGDTRAVGKEYTLNEIELATEFFSDGFVIRCGDHGVVYRGVLLDHSSVAVKNLLVNRAILQDLATEVESSWCLRHKNLVKFLGYSTEGTFSFLVSEYVDNDNLYQWLHERTCRFSPLTWKIRMNIIQGIAKGLAYLHEESETSISHQRLKSSNILLDKQWNPKISDFGLSRLLPSNDGNGDLSPPLGMSSYAAPEENGGGFRMDVYIFGVLVMEIVSGRTPVKYTATKTEEYLVDWMKIMVSEGELNGVLDPKLPELPSLIELKRVVLIALHCVDSDAGNRLQMGDVIHMLKPLDLLLSDVRDTVFSP